MTLPINDRNKPAPHANAPEPREKVPRLRSNELFRGHRRLIIEHAGEDYSLRLTRNKRLILTKS